MKRFRISLLTLFIVLTATAASAQTPKDSAWTTNGNIGLKLSQASFTNWATGGNNAFAFDLQGMYSAEYKYNKHLWTNRAELAYGMTNTKADGVRKTSDKIYFNSNYGYQVANNLYVSGLLNFQTQSAFGYNYGPEDVYMSKFMAPGYLMTGAGITWTPKKYFTAVFAPASWRGTFVLSDTLSARGAYGVTPGEHLLSEFGASLKLEVNYDIMKNINIYSRLDLFSNYLEKPQNIDVNWEVQLTMTINKWFSANLTTNLVYDDNITIPIDGRDTKRIQFREVLGVGLQYNF